MSESEESFSFSPEQFSGNARVFPLPNLVMFPHVMQPLHIFEPRYRAMLEEALEDDRLIAMGLLAPGWEQQSEGRPTLRNTACSNRVIVRTRGRRTGLVRVGASIVCADVFLGER